ncbi:MAG: hypothetical protein MK235_06250 [Candidatus Poseidoniales archaeon]|nr:hypothetical protein [Candidatus Poseidoniales archaeon]
MEIRTQEALRMGTLGWLLLFALIGAFLYWLGDRAIRRDAARADDDDDDEEFDPVALATAVALALGGVGAGAEAGDINLTGLDASEPVGMSMMLDMGEL